VSTINEACSGTLSDHMFSLVFCSLLDVFAEPAKSLLCRRSSEMTLNLVFEYVEQDLAQHIQGASSSSIFSETYIKVCSF